MSDPCEGCGLCCKRMILEIDHIDVVREPRLAEVAQVFKADPFVPADDGGYPLNQWDRSYMLNGGESGMACPMLRDGDRCSCYSTRPNMCIAFTAGSDKCNELRADAGLDPLPTPEHLPYMGEDE